MILDFLEPDQRAYIYTYQDDTPAQIVSFCAPRDSGKTYGALLYAIYVILTHNDVSVRYIAPTYRQSCDVVIPIIREITTLLKIENDLNIQASCVKCDITSSSIYFYGADNERLHDRLRGVHHNQLIILDECQEWVSDIDAFLNRVLIHTLTDTGRIFLLGTPGDTNNTFFHFASTSQIPYIYSISGKPVNNKYTKNRVKKRMDKMKRANPDIEKEPFWRREFLGEWVPDNRRLIYNINTKMNYINCVEEFLELLK